MSTPQRRRRFHAGGGTLLALGSGPKGLIKAVFRLAHTSFASDSGQKLTSTITGDCTAKG